MIKIFTLFFFKFFILSGLKVSEEGIFKSKNCLSDNYSRNYEKYILDLWKIYFRFNVSEDIFKFENIFWNMHLN